ncbi:MAG: outer membrane beta-barrel protein [Bacteroidetes bacterium]|nr:outer membrane beta-barrel protein [Bacteroidota bacterium]
MVHLHTIVRFRNMIVARSTNTILSIVLFLCSISILSAQEIRYDRPTWYYGGAAAVNLNFYGGTTQMLNSGLTVPAAFHKGLGAGLYIAPVLEYRPNTTWGGILQLGYDDRRAAFYDQPCPCGENSTLEAKISYLSLEPSIRFSPFSDEFYLFAGGRIGYNYSFSSPDEKTFLFTQGGTFAAQSQFSNMNEMVYSVQIGIGYDFPLTSVGDEQQVELSPFISFQPFIGQDPRSTETWGVSTVRIGASLKFGSGNAIEQPAPAVVVEKRVDFSVRVPKAVPAKRRVRESFPLRNYVFFDDTSSVIPARYEMLTKEEASAFKEEQLQEKQPKNLIGRSQRQLSVYYNVMNVVGDRMKRNPKANVILRGASPNGAAAGTVRAEAVKYYLVTVFGIDGNRIVTEGSEKPRIQSEIIGGTKELELLRAGDSRVDIDSESPEMMIQVGGTPHYMLKPVQIVAVVEDPLDSHILFKADGAHEAYASWSVEITDEKGKIQRVGPSTRNMETVSGNAILGDRMMGDYSIVMNGITKSGKTVRKETSIHLIRRTAPVKEAVRYSILFDFDKSVTVESYSKFISEVIVPQVPDSGIIVIHGYTDVIGEDEYNDNLSRERAQGVQEIMERAISKLGKKGITFETFGFGENLQYSPFDNYFPEQRFYNRSVIIDIVPD